MSRTGARYALLTAALLGSGLASQLAATTYHVCDCAAGSDADCQTGDDSALGALGDPWQSYEKARTSFGSLSAGDEIRFCRGGAWGINAGTRWVNASCRSFNPCTVGDYLAPWASGDEVRPILLRADDSHGFALEDGGNAEHEEGYVFENLDLRGSGNDAGWGFFLYNDIDDVVLRNLSISEFAIGVHLAGSNPCNQNDPTCDGQNDRISLERSSVFDNDRQGWLGASNDTRIVGNHFENNGTTAIFDHNIYISGSSGGQTTGIRVLDNSLFRSALDSGGVCRGVSLVVHGQHDDLRIEGNEVWEEIGLAGGGCWGIAVDNGYGSAEGFTHVVIAGNRVRNVGNLAIGVGACADCSIENNVVVHNQPFGVTAIAAPDRGLGAGDLAQDDITVRNNSIWIGPASGGTAISVRDMGDDHVVVSNAIHYAGTSSSFNCFRTDLPASSYTEIDNNICYFPSAGGAEWSDGYGTSPDPLSAWQIASGFGAGSLMADPGFSAPDSADLSADSAAAAMIDAGHPGLSTTVDHEGFSRSPLPDVGAWEWGITGSIFADGFEAADTSSWSSREP